MGGGDDNLAGGLFAMIPGGRDNVADGDYSFAAGREASALHDGAFVWADHSTSGVSSMAAIQGLYRLLEEKERRNRELEARLGRLEALISSSQGQR